MISSHDEEGNKVLHLSACLSSAAGLKSLLDEIPLSVVKVMLRTGGSSGRTPILWAARNGDHPDVISCLMEFIRKNFNSDGKTDIN